MSNSQHRKEKVEDDEINRLNKDFIDAIKRGDTECI